jgi:feruloyl-CoA synthase
VLLRYGDALRDVRAVGAGLLARGASAERPVAILADNGIAHATVAHAAMYVGVPVAPLSVGYARGDARPERLRALFALVQPALVFAGDDGIAARIAAADPDMPIVRELDALRGDPVAADAAAEGVGPETVAKILLTSGSTGTPKGVMTTNRMLGANQTMFAHAFPDVVAQPPTLVDWLPWSHCFGGSHNFGVVLRNGGTLYVDDGKPLPGMFDATLRNLREIAPSAYFNVPLGFGLLADALESDAAFARGFLAQVRLLCNAGAALPPALRGRLIRLVQRYAPRDVRVVSSWGTTETAPLATACWGVRPPEHDTIGVPVPGVAIKLAPLDDRFEIRVQGPNVTPGYWRDPETTAAAFDDEGYYRTGDAAVLRDADDPGRGIDFKGRLVENFKLATGTWVNVGALRLAVLDALAPLAQDVVVAGHDRDALAVLIFLARDGARGIAGAPSAELVELAAHPALRAHAVERLAAHNARSSGKATFVARALLLGEPPDGAAGEITDKGTINQRRALTLRAAAVARLLDEPDHPDVLTIG